MSRSTCARRRDKRSFTSCSSVSDVLIVGNRPSALTRWGIDWDSVHAAHPHIVMCHVSGYGKGGPASDRPGYGTLAEAMSGFAHADRPARRSTDTAAVHARRRRRGRRPPTYAVTMALYHRDVHGGGGQLVDVNLIEPLARLMESNTLAFDQLGVVAQRVGNRLDASAPRNAYRNVRRSVVGHLERVADHRGAAVPGHRSADDLAEDPDYVDPIRRQDRAVEVDGLVADWIRESNPRRGDDRAPRRRGRRRPGLRRRAAAGRRAPPAPGARSVPWTTPTSDR